MIALFMFSKTASGIQTSKVVVIAYAQEATTSPVAILEDKMAFDTPEAIKEAIISKSKASGLNPKTMVAIAKAESQFRNVPNYKYTNEKGYYTAYGIFQITRTTYRAFCGDPAERLDIEKNIDCAMKIATSSGLHHWSESADNW